MKHIVILTGAGVSAESGISTFRDAGGLWEGHDVMTVATPQGWAANSALVLKFYNERRRQLFDVKPNAAHIALKTLEKKFKVTIITQNVDDLHERAGSSNIIHLHGELRKARSTVDSSLIYDWPKDIELGDKCEKGSQLRPHIVWFKEAVPMMEVAVDAIETADIVMVIGSSMQVYPAAGLVAYAPSGAKVYYVDPNPAINYEMRQRDKLVVLDKKATEGVTIIVDMLMEMP
jgi:NAD-dependent deacetylase